MFFKLNLNKILSTMAIIAIFFIAGNAFAEDTKIVFTTDIQNISSGQISGPITIQLQDSAGNKQDATETIYLNLASSNSGELSSSKDSWKIFNTLSPDFSTSSVYISSGSANRTFYYKGLTSGEHIITVTAKSKSGKTFDSISQVLGIDINLGNSTTTDPVATTTQSTSTSQTATTTNTQVITKTVVKYISLHSNPEDLSDYDSISKFEISAGRERVGYVGMPIKFSAKSNSSTKGFVCSSADYTWVYGDGTKDTGEKVFHTYKFAGKYNVILNGNCGNESSVSRTKIEVLKPEVTFNLISSGDLEVLNLGKTEINMGGWSIIDSPVSYIFPDDTIISANGKIVLSKEYSKLFIINYDMIKLEDPSHNIVYSLDNKQNNQSEIVPSKTPLDIEVSKAEIDKFTMSFMKNSKKEIPVAVSNPVKEITNLEVNRFVKTFASSSKPSNIATVLESTKSLETKGFWKNLLGLPARGIKAVARVFYDVE